MQQKLFQNFVTTRSWSFWNNIEKEPQKPHPKLKEYLLYPQSNASGSFLLTYINFAEQRIKFSNFKGSTINGLFQKKAKQGGWGEGGLRTWNFQAGVGIE